MTEKKDIREFFHKGTRVHLPGIGGVSMCPLAEVLHQRGLSVQGSDMTESPSTRHLRDLGITVFNGHNADNLGDADLVIRTAAVRDNNPEIAGAIARGIPVYERAEAWGAIMRDYRHAVCVAGTHGKTTTTSMVTHIFLAAEKDPTVMIGGFLPALDGGYRVGQGDSMVIESCEYHDSFLHFFPTTAVILNVEEDHLDYFADLQAIEHSFRRFAELVPEDGFVVANADDPATRDTLRGLPHPVFYFSAHDRTAACHAENLTWEQGLPRFDVVINGKFFTRVSLAVGGIHNVQNALAAASAAYLAGIGGEAVAAGLAGFTGAKRRFERKGTFRGAVIYDDYAHHPTELKNLFLTAKSLGYRRIICAFQPHTYSRTERLFADFADVLRIPDVTVLGEIYAARESNDRGISSAALEREIPGSVYCPTLDKIADALRRIACEGDLILTVGAGDIYKVGEMLAESTQEK